MTADDARALGVPIGTLNALARRGQLEHVERGIYRVPLIPPGRMDQHMLATLWPDRRGRISHQSALDLYGISDVNPAKIHITVPIGYRTHREIPSLYTLHREDLVPAEQQIIEGVPAVTPAKAIRQARDLHLRPSLVEQAIEDGLREGWLSRRESEVLRAEMRDRAVE